MLHFFFIGDEENDPPLPSESGQESSLASALTELYRVSAAC